MGIFTSILPIFLLILTGLILRKLKFADGVWIKVLNRYALYIAFPALIINSFISIGILDFKLAASNFILQLIIAGSLFLLLKLFKVSKETINTYLICIMFGNIAYLGYPFITSLIPDSGVQVSIIIASSLVIYFGILVPFMQFSKTGKLDLNTFLTAIKNPLLGSVLIGLLLFFLNIPIPVWAKSFLTMAGGSASPTALVAIGIFLAEKFKFDNDMKHAIAITSLKLILFPLIFFIFMKSSPVAVLEAGMPVAVTTFSLAEEYPMKKKVVLYSIIISTLASAVTLTILSSIIL